MSRIFYMLLISISLLENTQSSINKSIIRENPNLDKKNYSFIFKNLKPLQSDKTFGKYLRLFLKELRRNKLNKEKIKKLILLSRISFSFKKYEPILKKSKKIAQLNKKNDPLFHKTCTFNKKYEYLVFSTISNYLKKYCNDLFIRMAYSSENSFLLKKDHFNYLSTNFDAYLEGKNQ